MNRVHKNRMDFVQALYGGLEKLSASVDELALNEV